MGGEGTAGLLSLLIREGELDRGEVEVGLLTSCGARGIQGEAGDTHMGTEANRGRVSNKFRDGVRDTHRNGTERWGMKSSHRDGGREGGGAGERELGRHLEKGRNSIKRQVL